MQVIFAQRCGGGPIPGNIQSQVGRGFVWLKMSLLTAGGLG